MTPSDAKYTLRRVKNSPSQAAAIRLSLVLLAGGALHFVAPKFFDSIIPPLLPGSPRIYTNISGTANLITGVGMAVPRTRKTSSVVAAVLFVGYIPAKIQLAVDWWRNERLPMPVKIGGVVQIAWQLPLVTESLKARRNAPG